MVNIVIRDYSMIPVLPYVLEYIGTERTFARAVANVNMSIEELKTGLD